MQIGPPANVIVMTPVPTVVLFPGSIVTQRLRDQLRPGFSLLDLVSMQCFNLRREHSQAKTEYLEMLEASKPNLHHVLQCEMACNIYVRVFFFFFFLAYFAIFCSAAKSTAVVSLSFSPSCRWYRETNFIWSPAPALHVRTSPSSTYANGMSLLYPILFGFLEPRTAKETWVRRLVP